MNRLTQIGRHFLTVALLIMAGMVIQHEWWHHKFHAVWVQKHRISEPRMALSLKSSAGPMLGAIPPVKQITPEQRHQYEIDWANVAIDAGEKVFLPLFPMWLAFENHRRRKEVK